MIMQEFEPKRRNTKISTSFDESPITNISLSNKNTSSFDEQVPIFKAKRQTPFPYLKRKSIRIDLVLKQQKLAQKKKNEQKLLESLRNDKKLLENENMTLKGRIMQMEFILQQLKSTRPSTQTHSTQPKKSNKSTDSIQCTKCQKCLSSKYFKYHDRICGNTKLNRLLSETDLKRLQFLRKNQKTVLNFSPKNDWRRKREEFLAQIKSAQKKHSSNCIIFFRTQEKSFYKSIK
ncbi:predicted protein [Naegleria gruberi]|uniref:Predicted protein n=1 Tax=Naegleria gruberi TaxID=5762 RepID=D2V406_NAEGR|nr:uncharacterized protein NAEGRDRAFT_63553 [Naegleria gruberi]EFC48293.1 predicted protein [Naegleria gruberi]|eukprot:XP_002681037.1 predicted protein [Naegleria gruberi strain NEG-M]